MKLDILYRGPLSSCNYRCGYCPFAKRDDDADCLAADRAGLERLVQWVASRPPDDRIGLLFTPWGEALVRPWYREAMIRLSYLPQVRRVAAQTNLSCALDWLADGKRERIALWATWHPSQVGMDDFLGQCARLDALGIRYSVGVVGLRAWVGAIAGLRRRLASGVYLWVNAYRDEPNHYDAATIEALTAIDPLFPLNLDGHASRGQPCGAGEWVVAVDGEGVVRRCHFVASPIGHLDDPSFEQRVLRSRLCPNDVCDCHIGYVHLKRLGLDQVFGDGILERIPCRSPVQAAGSHGAIVNIGE
jgi:hypothetical protein